MDPSDQDLPYQLPRDLYYQIIHALRAALPPLPTDDQEDHARRDRAAIAQVASLLPANAEEASLAAQYVAANAQALDCLRLVREHPANMRLGLNCMAQAASMMRQARGARSLLMKVQAQRQKREANSAANDAAGWVEHCVIGLMADALHTRPRDPHAGSQPPQAWPVEPGAAGQTPLPPDDAHVQPDQRAAAAVRRAVARLGVSGGDTSEASECDSADAPGNAMSGHVVPGSGAPSSAAPGNAAPGNAAPGYVAPENALPGNVVPGTGAPGNAPPGNAAPENASPGNVVPGTGAPGHVAPGHVAPGHVAPGHVASGNAPPGHAVPGLNAPHGPLRDLQRDTPPEPAGTGHKRSSRPGPQPREPAATSRARDGPAAIAA